MTKQLMAWARSVSGMGKRSGGTEFSSQAALQSYMRQHPKADASNHSVAQAAKPETRSEESSHTRAAESAPQTRGAQITRDTPAARAEATAQKDSLKKGSKEEIFKIWRRETQGRLNVARIGEQRKSWMIYDIIKARHGKEVAEAV